MKKTIQKIMCAMILLSAGSTFAMEAPKKTDDLDPAIKLIRYFVHHMNGTVKKLTGVYEIDDTYLFNLYYADNLSQIESNKKIRINFDKRQEKKILENYKEALKKYRAKKALELARTKNIFGPFLFCALRENLSGKKILSSIPKSIISHIFRVLFGKKELINHEIIERLALDGLPFLFVESMLQTDEDQNSSIKIIKHMIDKYKTLWEMPEYKKIIKPYEPLLKLKMKDQKDQKDQKEKRIQKEFHRFIDGNSEKYYKRFFDLETRTIKAIDHLINKYLKKPGHGFINLSFPEEGYDFSEKGTRKFHDILDKNIEHINHLTLRRNNNLNFFSLQYCPQILNLEDYDWDFFNERPNLLSLRKLYLSNNYFQYAYDLIKNSPNLEVLSIKEPHCEVICGAIKENKSIKKLFFGKYFFHFENKSIKKLFFGKPLLPFDSAQILFDSLTDHPLTTLSLNIAEWQLDPKNNLHILNLFFNFIKNNKTLLNVYLDFEQCGGEFEERDNMDDNDVNNLKKLYINRIELIENSIIEALAYNKTMKSFSFSFRLFDDIKDDIKLDLNHFHESLNKNTSIEKLRLMRNDLCSNLDLTFNILQEQKYIRSLIMDFYPEKNVVSFLDLIKKNKTITSLKICSNFFHKEQDIFGFFNAMKYNEGILRLKLTRPNQEKEGEFFDLYLKKYLMENKKLQFLYIDLSCSTISTLNLVYIAEALKINKESKIQTLFFTDKTNDYKYLNCNKLDGVCQIIQKNFLCNIEKYPEMLKIRLNKRIENNTIQTENNDKQQFNHNNKKRKLEEINNNFKQENQNKDIKSEKQNSIDAYLESLLLPIKEYKVFMSKFKEQNDIIKKKIKKWNDGQNFIIFKEKVQSLYAWIDQCAKNNTELFNAIVKNGIECPSSDKVFFERMKEDSSRKEKKSFIKFIKERINSLTETRPTDQKNLSQIFIQFIYMNFPYNFDKIYNEELISPNLLFLMAKNKFHSEQQLALNFIKKAANQNHLASCYFVSLIILSNINNQTIDYQKKAIDIMLFFKMNGLLSKKFSALLPNNFTDYDVLINVLIPRKNPIDMLSRLERLEKISSIAKMEFLEAKKMFRFSN